MAARRRVPRRLGTCLLVGLLSASCSGSVGGGADETSTTVAPETTTTTEAPLEAGRQVFVYTPAVGQCFDRRELEERPATGPQQTDIVLLLDCGLPHQNEVFDVLEMRDAGPGYPGETAMNAYARRTCPQRFEEYVGTSYEVSVLEIGYYLPSSSEWDSGARRLGCYLYDVNGDRLTGSMRGSMR
jgi:hypothetical protein